MKTFLATTLTDTAVSQDKRRFQLTFVDADGQKYAISIPAAIAADLVPVLEFGSRRATAPGGWRADTHPEVVRRGPRHAATA